MQQSSDGHRLAELSAFVAVAETGSFTAASLRLGRDATVLSRRIQALERRLGVRFLQRTTRRVTVTEAGLQFLQQAQAVLRAIDEAEHAAAAHAGDAPRGTLRLALPGTFGRMWMAPLLPDFLIAHPQVRIDVEFANRFVDLVGEGFDVAVRLGALPDSTLVAHRLATRHRLVCASPGFVARHGLPRRPEDLGALPCLAFSGLATHPLWHFTHADGTRATLRVQGPLVSDDAEALVHAAVNDCGAMLATDWLVGRELADGRLVPILQDWRMDDEGAVHVVTPTRALQPAKTRAFVAWLRARFEPSPPWRKDMPRA